MLKGPLDSVAAGIRNAKRQGGGVNEQAAAGLQAGYDEVAGAQQRKVLTYGAIGLGAIILLVLVLRK